MRLITLLCLTLVGAAGVGPAAVAATCQTDAGATCTSGMPLGGYCECNVRGRNVSGTIIGAGSARSTARSFQPNAPAGQ